MKRYAAALLLLLAPLPAGADPEPLPRVGMGMPPITITTDERMTQKLILKYTSQKRDYTQLLLDRSERYRNMILAALQAEGLPADLLYIPMIESGYDPRAVSRSGAAGMWQLMPETARRLGLKVNAKVDERFDTQKATKAAIRHLKHLHRNLGHWTLVVAAYNCGEGRLGQTLRGERRLPAETRHFIHKFVAYSRIGRDPSSYGFLPMLAARPRDFGGLSETSPGPASVSQTERSPGPALSKAASKRPMPVRRMSGGRHLSLTGRIGPTGTAQPRPQPKRLVASGECYADFMASRPCLAYTEQ